jgi:hypothetical protein
VKILEEITNCNGRSLSVGNGKMVMKIIRNIHTLLMIMRLSSQNIEDYHKKVTETRLMDDLVNIVDYCCQLEKSDKFLALPCYFYLRIRQNFYELLKLPFGQGIVKNLVLRIFDKGNITESAKPV